MADTRDKLMDIAEELLQTVGYNAFSFHDLADRVGIKSASIHYYFPTKTDLGVAVTIRYRERFQRMLKEITESHDDPMQQLKLCMGLFRQTLATGRRVCLCGMLSSDIESIPKELQVEVRTFFDDLEMWIANVLRRAQKLQLVKLRESPEATSIAIVATLEGAMLTARTNRSAARFQAACDWIISSLVQR
ncbi:MAG TPA: TetR/AcrR family transcriptional regulator [Phycisphaerales bacterium]|nr:TetR/AcrR family transcriptional regulator [Phycisphaerales bacterium]